MKTAAEGALLQPCVLVLCKSSGCPRGKLEHAAGTGPDACIS